VIDSATKTVARIGPGRQAFVVPLQVGFDIKSEPRKLQVTTLVDHYAQADDVSECGAFSFGDDVALKVVSAAITRDKYSSGVIGRVKNPTTSVVGWASIDCILRAGTTIVGGTSTDLEDPIPPGGTIAFEASALGWVAADANAVECRITA
jgi:hypothetical protein